MLAMLKIFKRVFVRKKKKGICLKIETENNLENYSNYGCYLITHTHHLINYKLNKLDSLFFHFLI